MIKPPGDNPMSYAAVAVPLTCVLILLTGGYIIFRLLLNKEKSNPFAPHAIQILGLTFLLPVILVVFATQEKVGADAFTALLGSIIGYLFGTATAIRPPRSPAQPPDST